jgi:hypothetical protein
VVALLPPWLYALAACAAVIGAAAFGAALALWGPAACRRLAGRGSSRPAGTAALDDATSRTDDAPPRSGPARRSD